MSQAPSPLLRRLPLSLGPPDRLLLDPDGRPTWPVTTDERAALERIAELFGFLLVVAPSTRPAPEPSGDGLVMSLGDECAPLARLYAHLTGRSWRVAKDAAALPEPGSFDVLVTLEGALPSTVMDRLYSPHLTRAPGILQAPTPAELRLQVLVRSAAAVMGGDAPAHRVDVLPVFDLAYHTSEGFTALGGKASREDLVDAVTGGHAVVTVFTHSDGIDADLGPGLVLCPVDRSWEDDRSPRQPTCRLTRQCYRLQRPMDDPAISSELLHPGAISARAFVFNSCVGVMPSDFNTDPSFGLGVRLVQNPRIGALLTSWRPTIGPPDVTKHLARMLASGVSAGVALAHHNALQHELGTGHRLGLFGDPSLRVAPASEPEPVRPAPRVEPLGEIAPQKAPPLAQLDLLTACLGGQDRPRVGSSPALDTLRAKVEGALRAIDAYRAAAPRGAEDAEGAEMRRRVTDLLAHRGRFCDLWLKHASRSRMAALEPGCAGCANSTALYEIDLKLPGVERRHLEICPRCSFTRDVPIGEEAVIEVERGGVVRLRTSVVGSHWAASLAVHYRWPLPGGVWSWPARLDGSPARELRVPVALHPAPAAFTLTMMAGTRLLFAGRTLRPVEPVLSPDLPSSEETRVAGDQDL